jgi:membrane-bound lytic murein transglycosylase B
VSRSAAVFTVTCLLVAVPGCAGGGEGGGDSGGAGPSTARPSAGRPSTTRATTAPASADERRAAEAVRTAEAPGSAEALAAVIADAESAVRDPHRPIGSLATWGRAHQLAYRSLARRPEWDEAVARAVDVWAATVERNVLAFRELWALTEPRDALPDWRIVAPPPAADLLDAYRDAEAATGVGWEFLAAINLVESRLGRIRGASSAGALGPMQFLPATWDAYGEGDIEDPHDAIRAAARYLVAHGAPADMGRALFAYNHSDHYVAAVRAYAEVLADDERSFAGYYHWDVYYRLTTGDVRLPLGWTLEQGHPDP